MFEDEITIIQPEDNSHPEVSLYGTYFLGKEDAETEKRFGSIGFSERALATINKTSLKHIEHEVGGLLIGWIDNGIKYVADVLTYIPANAAAGQFAIMDGEADMLEQLETINTIHLEGTRQLQVLGWWHTHPPGSNTQTGYPPIPGGGTGTTGRISGDLGVNHVYSAKFGTPQEMLIVETTVITQPIRFALWRWDATPQNETAHYQAGIRVVRDQTDRVDADLPLPDYWPLPEGGQKQHSLHTRQEDIITMELD